ALAAGSGNVHRDDHDRAVVDVDEPVRRLLGHDDQVALGDAAGRAVGDGRAGQVLGVAAGLVHQGPAGDQVGAALDHIEELGPGLVHRGPADRGAVFEVGAVGGQPQQRLDEVGFV